MTLLPSRKVSIAYRPEIDGLRALAIVPVVLYHYGLTTFAGGFVGVDIFFVISGFLITTLLLKDLDTGEFSVLRFYERRARRILPALFLVLIVTTILSLWALLPVDLMNFGKSLLATTAFSSNIFFWRQVGYFDREAELKPLLHTWSLSVEEQFYIVFPLTLWLVARFWRERLVWILGVCLATSLAMSILVATLSWFAGFYLPVTRSWELLTGGVLATGAIPPIRNVHTRWALSLIGLLFILMSVVLIDRSMPFPGWIAIIPCLGAALLIFVSISGGSIVDYILKSKPLVGIGLISYSLYLWHWPLLVIARYATNRELTSTELSGLLAIVTALSIFSWRYVEEPFRRRPSRFDRSQIFKFTGIGSAIAAGIGAGLVLSTGVPSRFPNDVLRYAQVAVERLDKKPGCFNLRAEDVRQDRLCRIGADSPVNPSFIIWGDSHADRLSVPLSEIARVRGDVGLLAAVESCPPLLTVQWRPDGCAAFNNAVFELVLRKRLKLVVLAGLWANYAEGTLYKQSGSGRHVLIDEFSVKKTLSENPAVFDRALRRTVESVTGSGASVIVIGPVPEISSRVPESLAKAQSSGGTKDIGPTGKEFMVRQRNVFSALQGIAGINHTQVVYPSTASCTPDCVVERFGQVLYVDDNHLSKAGLDLIKPLLEQAFDVEDKFWKAHPNFKPETSSR